MYMKHNLRRSLAILLVLLMIFVTAACKKSNPAGQGGTAPVNYTVTLDKTALTMAEDSQAVLTATVQPEGQATWNSSDDSVVSVNGGRLLAKKPGSVTITAAIGGKTAACQVTVTATDGSFMYLEPSNSTYAVEIGGEACQVAFTLYKVAVDGTKTEVPNAAITYRLENEKLATLEGDQITGVVSGATSVVAETDGCSASAEVKIYDMFVSDAEEWCKMLSSRTLGASFLLDGDIDFAGKTYTGTYTGVPAAVKSQSFRGTLDGNGHTVKNIRLGGSGYASLFGQLYSAQIRNIAFENVELSGGSGLATSISGQNTLVENVSLELRFTQRPASGHILLNTAFGGTLRNVLVTVTAPGKNTDNLDLIGTLHSLNTTGVYVLAEGALEPCGQIAAYSSKMEMVADVNSQKQLPLANWSYSGGAELPTLLEN